MRVKGIISTLILLFVLSACSSDSEVEDTAVSAMSSCLYNSTEYSVGFRMQSGKAINTGPGKIEVVEDPNGIWMTCSLDESGQNRWVADNS